MRKRDWIYLVNPFDQLTKKNRKLLFQIADYHINMLQLENNPVFDALYQRVQQPFTTYKTHYNTWQNTKGISKGSTKRTDLFVVELRGKKVQQWEQAINKALTESPEEYTKLFPKGKRPFQQGSVENRIKAVGELAINLEPHAHLAETKKDVLSFFNSFNSMRRSQHQKDGEIELLSQAVEESREPLVKLLYQNLGVLIDYYNGDGNKAGDFFPIKLM